MQVVAIGQKFDQKYFFLNCCYIEATRNEIKEKVQETRPSKYLNLTIKERKAMQELQSRKDIVITDTDKGGAVVILRCGRLC